MTDSMKAVLVTEPGGPENLTLGPFPKPSPAPDELLVRVAATALNRADILQRQGKYPPPPGTSELLGLEIAGTVAECGENCVGFAKGDRVFGLLGGGGYAEYAVINHRHAMPIPESMSMEEAAAVPEAFLTAYQALFWLGDLYEGATVLVHAGASGVGTTAIQLAREAEARVIVTASAAKHVDCIALGATHAIDYKNESFPDVVREITGGKGVDIIIDFIGAPYFKGNVDSLAMDGRIVILATMGGTIVPEFNIRDLFRRRGQVITSALRNRSIDYKARLTAAFATFALPRLEDGRLRPIIDRVFDWADVAEAHQRMESNLNVGKIVLRIGGPGGAVPEG
ncbi:MAG TPA: NAD(P)H-quinone oxidoreductase [Rhodothermales bacterium]